MEKINLRPCELVFLFNRNSSLKYILKLIFFDFLHRQIFTVRQIKSKYKGEMQYCSYLFLNFRELNNIIDNRVLQIFHGLEYISIKEFFRSFYMLDNSEGIMSGLIMHKRISHYIKQSLIDKKILKRKLLFLKHSNKGKKLLTRYSINEKHISFSYLTIKKLYEKKLKEKFNLELEEFEKFNNLFEKEYELSSGTLGITDDMILFPVPVVGIEYLSGNSYK